MFFSKRKRYNGQVALLLPAFGFTLDEAGMIKTLDCLDIAWQQGYSEYEAALFIAYLVFSGMLKTGSPRAHDVIGRIQFLEQEWISKGVVREDLATRFRSKADEWMRKLTPAAGDRPDARPSFQITGNMPDITQREPARVFRTKDYLILLLKDVPPVGDQCGPNPIQLRFTYVMLVADATTRRPLYLVTLERSMMAANILGTFDGQGRHANLGAQDSLSEENAFVTEALSLIGRELKLDHIEELRR